MTKIVDSNGFWTLKNNPITRAGVYPYLGRQISDSLEPNKVYHVLRPLDELTSAETIESFNGVPLINNHEMIGEGFTPYDDRPAGGALFNPQISENGLNGDLRIYSEKIKNAIENGKKELSLGYLCDYELTSGVFDGKKYDAIQRHIRGNHIALVDKGRMGADVRVYDHSITMDSMDLGIDAMDYDDSQPRDEVGKWTDEGGSADERKLKFTGNELGYYIDIKDLRNKAKAYYKEHYQGKTIEREGLGVVNFSGRGIRETISGGAQTDKIKLIPAIGDIIRYGTIGKEAPLKHPRNDDIVAFIPITSKINLGDKSLDVGVLIGRDSNGNLYYDMFIKKQPNDSATLSEVGLNKTDNSAYDSNIAQDTLNVKINDKKISQDEIPSSDGSPKESGVGSFSQYGEDEMADKREAIRKIMAIAAKSDSDFKGGEEEKIDTIAKLLEGSEYSKSEHSNADDKAAKDKKCKDEDDKKPNQEDKKDDKTETKQEETKDAKKGMDEMAKEIMAQIAARDALVKEVEPLVGSFACDSMSVEEVAAYACDKLGLKADGCDSKSLIKGYIAARGAKRVFGLDNAIEQNGVDKATEKYLMGD